MLARVRHHSKEEDIVEDLFVASTHSFLLFFTNKGKVHWTNDRIQAQTSGGSGPPCQNMLNAESLSMWGKDDRYPNCLSVFL